MSNSVLTVIVVILVILLIGVIGFIWYQFNSTDSRLVRIIEDRIRYDKMSSEQDDIESIDDLEEETE
jgi:uncharacterized protein YxeA